MRKHPRVRVAFTSLVAATVLFWGTGAHAQFFPGGGKDAAKGNDCLIGYNGVDPDQVTQDGKKNVVMCTDCNPECDLDGNDTANGACTFKVGVCINQPGVEGCTPASGLDKAKASGKVKGTKGKISVEIPQLLQGSACGGFLDLVVPVKETKKGAKNGSGKVTLSASLKKNKAEGITKARKDKDKLSFICVPRPEGETCPTVTTTTSTSTTTTIPVCGDGVINGSEECDTALEPTGCAGGETCIANCTCAAGCAAPTAGQPTGLTFRTGIGTTQCGSPGFTPTVASAPFGGTLDATSCTCATAADCGGTTPVCVQGHCTSGAANRQACTQSSDCANGQTCEAYTLDLGLGCLYIGGGVSTVPGGNTPDDAPTTFGVDLVCDGDDTLSLGGGDTGDPKTCTLADGPTKYCANGNPGNGPNNACDSDDNCRPNCTNVICHGGDNDGQPCTGAADCPGGGTCFGGCVNGAPGSDGNGRCVNGNQCGTGSEGTAGVDGLICVPRPNCFFGPPLPVRNDALSTCVLNVFDTDAHGAASVAAGQVTVGYTLSSRVYFTSLSYTPDGAPAPQPCPVCVDGLGAAVPSGGAGTCNFGPNQGQACVGVGVDATTQDCPPDGFFFLAPLSVTLDPLTTATSTMPADGNPSANGLFCPKQGNGGAFKVPAARLVTMVGSPVAGGLDTTPKAGTLASAFCIPTTGSVVIDGAANLPGPGGTTLGGTLQLDIP